MTGGNGATIQKVAIFGFKFAVTAVCFWYISRQIRLDDLARAAGSLDFRWIAFAVIVAMSQIPLAGLRWSKVTDALEPGSPRVPVGLMIAITSITVFFGQFLPNLMSDAIRVWLLARTGRTWRRGIVGVLIDRGIGVGTLVAVGFVTLLFPSALTALGGYRLLALLIFGLLLAAAIGGLVFAPLYVRILIGFRATKWIGEFIAASRRVLIESPNAIAIVGIALAIHVLTIICIWSLGQAFAMALSVVDASVLFTLMVAIAILPISVGGWGLRELAMTAFLDAQGIPTQQAFLFSVCFGLTLLAASIPGVFVLMFFSPRKATDKPAPSS
jgi:uncharacterized protein (TIRG00374 family)